jgi:hypothetical protein
MKNRAKCNLCNDILTPMDNHIIKCKCGEICLDGINKIILCNTSDDNYSELNDEVIENMQTKPTRKEMIDILGEMAKNIESLPEAALSNPITHYDHLSLILLLSEILRSD